jgi:hydroxymethylpyrimidine kinase/phosphomethylpyrimidine kinase
MSDTSDSSNASAVSDISVGQTLPKRVRVLSIAGTDPSGGAGLMADLRTMAALGAYGMGVVTNVVAQNTQGVRAVQPMSGDIVTAQLSAVSDDVVIDGIKIGMLGSAEIIAAVQKWLASLTGSEQESGLSAQRLGLPEQGRSLSVQRPSVWARKSRPVTVLDPVMISTSGTRLLDSDAVAALVTLISSGLIDVVTPNIPELSALLETVGEKGVLPSLALTSPTWSEVLDGAARLSARTGTKVYAKAGHLEGTTARSDALVSWDRSAQQAEVVTAPGTLVDTKNTHGTGCTLSSALAVLGAQGESWTAAAMKAKTFMNGAIAHADELQVGQGHGPIDQLWNTTYGDAGNTGTADDADAGGATDSTAAEVGGDTAGEEER